MKKKNKIFALLLALCLLSGCALARRRRRRGPAWTRI